MLEHDWTFEVLSGATEVHLFGFTHMHEIYTCMQPDITTRVTVPVLWDKKLTLQSIINHRKLSVS